MRQPDAQFRAGHIPADIYRQIPPGTDPTKVVIVQAAPRSYAGPILLTLTITGCTVVVLVVIALTFQVIAASVIAVLSATCGIGFTLRRSTGPKQSRPVRAKRSRPVRAKRPRPKRSRPVRKSY